MSKSKIAATLASLTAVFGLVAGGNWVLSPRITEREIALRIAQGRLTDSDVEPGVKTDNWRPGVHYIRLPATLQKTTVQAGEKDSVTIRTRENSRIYGNFEVHFTINKKDENFGKAYTELKVDEIDDITPFIKNYVLPAAIDVYQNIPVLEVNKDIPGVGKQIKDKLQGYLNDRGYTYIKILDVIPSGVGLSREANDMLEQIVKEERKKALLVTQGQVATMSKDITEKQTDVTLAALKKYRDQGMTYDQALEAFYMTTLHVNDNLGKAFVAGPFHSSANNTGAAVAVQAPKATAAPAAPAPKGPEG